MEYVKTNFVFNSRLSQSSYTTKKNVFTDDKNEKKNV